MPQEPEFDVFLAHTRDDGPWAERLYAELADRRLKAFLVSRLASAESWGKAVDEALLESRVLVVLWSLAARGSELVRQAIDRFASPGAIIVVELGSTSGPPLDDVNPIKLVDDDAYERGPDGLSPAAWKAVVRRIERVVSKVAGQAAALQLSPSVRGLSRRLPGEVTGTEIVVDLLSTHSGYARGKAKDYDLGADPETALRQPVDAWIAEVSGLFDATQQRELHGRQLILGLGLASPPLGRRLRDSGLFQEIEGELREGLDSILTSLGRAARDALEPLPLAGYAADNLLGEDMLDLRAEVAALCAVISAKTVHPPLSIGLFGPWGSGKSFFMQLMRREIDRIQAGARQAREQGRDDPFCEEIVQIDFNAWHYLDANLWASLMARIWEQLAAHGDGTSDAPDRRHRELFKRLETSSALQRAAERDARSAKQRVREAQTDLAALAKQRAAANDTLERLGARDAAREVADDPDVRSAIADVERQAGLPEGTLNLAELRELATDIRLGRLRAVWGMLRGRQAWRRGILLLTGLALAIGLALIFARELVASAIVTAGAVLGGLAAAGKAILTVVRPAAALTTAVDDALERAHQAEAARAAQIAQAERAQRTLLLGLEEEAAARRNTLLAANERKDDAERAIAEIAAGRAAARFIAERAASPDYERHLGLISIIQRDLATLSKLMAPPDTPGQANERDENLPQIDRIVLYIDDLDRCPAHLVIEVLQAVHLLLAYPLFVVVVGVDPRWLVSSLTRHHSAMLGSEAQAVASHDGDDIAWTSKRPQEYLEKIFQLPLILRPMEVAGYERLVSQLLPVHAVAADGDQSLPEGSNGRDGGPAITQTSGDEEAFDPGHRSLEIVPAELQLVQQLWPLMPSPRAVKRLSNVYRFLRAQVTPHELDAFTGESEGPGDYPAVLFLLAVLIGLPEDAPAVLKAVCDPKHTTWEQALAATSGVPQPALAKLREATKGYDDYPLERVRDRVPSVVRFSFSFWEITSPQSEPVVHAS